MRWLSRLRWLPWFHGSAEHVPAPARPVDLEHERRERFADLELERLRQRAAAAERFIRRGQ